MKPLTEPEIRSSMVNASKGEAGRMSLPRGFADLPWDDLDFLGWRDPGAPERAWLVAEREGRLVGLSLRVASGAARGFTSRSICSICLTTRTGGGVALLTARRTGAAGRQGNSIGQYMCADLACPLYVRGKKDSAFGGDLDEHLSLAERIDRALGNLFAFIDRL